MQYRTVVEDCKTKGSNYKRMLSGIAIIFMGNSSHCTLQKNYYFIVLKIIPLFLVYFGRKKKFLKFH